MKIVLICFSCIIIYLFFVIFVFLSCYFNRNSVRFALKKILLEELYLKLQRIKGKLVTFTVCLRNLQTEQANREIYCNYTLLERFWQIMTLLQRAQLDLRIFWTLHLYRSIPNVYLSTQLNYIEIWLWIRLFVFCFFVWTILINNFTINLITYL